MSPFFEGILSGLFVGVFIGVFVVALLQASRKNWLEETGEEPARMKKLYMN